ncbi:hypothetical protein CMUS01_08236 [Colletotrichum musicola]|uniref:Uncharacterized protein n=1 Tax=Colletotrichum musicola TaxID=2175873 RepID=A0A8H6NDT8_9PEZI|nr:hypothetical protein CMUS01_08236 [Colletotrichum musicola]
MFVSKDWMICTALPYQPTSPTSMFPPLLWRFNRQRWWPQIDWLRNCVHSTSNGTAADGNGPDSWTPTVPCPAPRRAGSAHPVAARTGPRGGYRDLPVAVYVLVSSVPSRESMRRRAATQAIQHLHHHANASACTSTNSIAQGLLLASVVPEDDGRMSPSKRKHFHTARRLVSAPANNLQRPVFSGPSPCLTPCQTAPTCHFRQMSHTKEKREGRCPACGEEVSIDDVDMSRIGLLDTGYAFEISRKSPPGYFDCAPIVLTAYPT